MKKFSLSVSEPCHENWDQMTPEQKGRFCASCQKTVVDFTNMSDRQIAEFFKKPAASTCGRFYPDQLNREIVVPKKQMPWTKYVFHLLWPAFVLFLKSCGQKEKQPVKTIERKKRATEQAMTMGIIFPEITLVDTSVKEEIVAVEELTTVGIVLLSADSVYEPASDTVAVSTEAKNNVDTASVVASEVAPVLSTDTMSKEEIVMGKVAVGDCKVASSSIKEKEAAPVLPGYGVRNQTMSLYPNPVLAGQRLAVLPQNMRSGVYQVLSISGQQIGSGKFTVHQNQPFTVPVQSWPVGVYVLRLIDEKNKESQTTEFVVQ